MKTTWVLGLLIVSNFAFGQIPGKNIAGPIILFDTLTIKKGDVLYLGNGSDPETGNFVYLYAPQNKVTPLVAEIIAEEFTEQDIELKSIPRMDLNRGFAGKELAIERFSKVSSKKEGEKILGVINMKNYQFIEGVFFNAVVVDFEPAIRSGEIIKISAPDLTENPREAEPLFSPFEMTKKGIQPVIVAFNNANKNELYTKAILWANGYYESTTTATITPIQDEKISIKDIEKNVKVSTIMGADLYADLPYQFTVDFSNNEIQMTFTLGGKNGDITADDGEVVASIAPSRIFDKSGDVRKMSQVLKVEGERIMNDVSYALVDYLLK